VLRVNALAAWVSGWVIVWGGGECGSVDSPRKCGSGRMNNRSICKTALVSAVAVNAAPPTSITSAPHNVFAHIRPVACFQCLQAESPRKKRQAPSCHPHRRNYCAETRLRLRLGVRWHDTAWTRDKTRQRTVFIGLGWRYGRRGANTPQYSPLHPTPPAGPQPPGESQPAGP